MTPVANPRRSSATISLFRCPDEYLMPVHVCRPKLETKLPGILFVYEAFGLNDEMKRIAGEIAAFGYVVIVPDLLSRGSWLSCIRRLMKNLSTEDGQGIHDLLAARGWLSRQPYVDEARMGVVGLCLGGGFAMVLSKTGLFQVAAPFYGPVPQSLNGACPMVASFGARDRIMSPAATRLEAELRNQGVPSDVKTYSNTGHAFMNRAPNAFLGMLGRYSPVHAGYDAEAARDSMERMRQFLATHI